MKVVLLQDIDKIGKKYEVKEIADGYAKNFLIPKGLARLADKEALAWAKEQREMAAKKAEEDLEKIGNLVSEIDGLEVEIPVKVGDKGQFFEKISKQKISARLKGLGYDIKKEQIELAEDIKDLGEFDAKIKFEHNLEAQIKVIVVQEDEDLIKEVEEG